jgi:undecaprenyl-diphosphatase
MERFLPFESVRIVEQKAKAPPRELAMTRIIVVLLLVSSACEPAFARGPLLIDHRIGIDNAGIWQRPVQHALFDATLLAELGGALYEGGNTRIGKTTWQAVDSTVLTGAATQVLKYSFQRERPSQTADPGKFFAGIGNQSFPSGEVSFFSAAVTPFILEYHNDDPWVWGLAALPLYDAIARVKTRGHWQSDVLVSLALGTAIGWYSHSRSQPLILTILPHGFYVGLKVHF